MSYSRSPNRRSARTTAAALAVIAAACCASPCSAGIVPQTCPADLNADGFVGSPDLAILLGSWGPGAAPADLDHNSFVGASDLAILLGSWGPCPPAPVEVCFFSEGFLDLRLFDDHGVATTTDIPITYAFEPMCLQLAPGPYHSGQDIPVTLLVSRHQGQIPDETGLPDESVDLSMTLLGGIPATGVISNVIAGPAGELLFGNLTVDARFEFHAYHHQFVGGLATLLSPVRLVAPVQGDMPMLTPKISSSPELPPAPLVSMDTGAIVGDVEHVNIDPTEPATPIQMHECSAPPDCTVGCPTGVQISIPNTIATGTGADTMGEFGAKIRFTFVPASKYCEEFAWKLETVPSDNGCGLGEGDIVKPDQERNAKCRDEDRRIVIEYTARLNASGQNPPCGCATVSTVVLKCISKSNPQHSPPEPFFTAEIKWERLTNGHAKITVTPVPGQPVMSSEIVLPTGIPCP